MFNLIWSHFMKILTKIISQFTNTGIYVQNKSQKRVWLEPKCEFILTKMFLN